MRIAVAQILKVLSLLFAVGVLSATARQAGSPPVSPAPQFTMTSSAYADGAEIPVKYTCGAVSPPLQWSTAPPGAVTYTLILHGPDAQHPPKDMSDVTHWIIWNIPASLMHLPEAVPAVAHTPDGMIQGENYKDGVGYAGPCPPPGKPHHYIFELYVLDTNLPLGSNASRTDVVKAMDGHIIAKAAYIGVFHR